MLPHHAKYGQVKQGIQFANVIEKYNQIRGKHRSDFGFPFWDIVVITAVDDDQKNVYKCQLEYKYQRNELPLDIPFHIVADPPGPKIGNGGSTLTCLDFLYSKYGENLFHQKILLIHAGGQSQRMPSASTLGKIYVPIPKGDPIYQMLDVKLATFCPLINRMGPGVFVTCADDFLIYNLGDDKNVNNDGIRFAERGFTALAHPSTVAVGTGHGVYVVKDIDNIDPNKPLQICECLEVLQKPDEITMYKKGAVLKTENPCFCDAIQISGKAVYTDSSFFFAHDISRKLLAFLRSHGTLQCEIDAYGDFMQALGPNASSEYINNISNVSAVTANLHKTRWAIYDLLKGADVALLVMNSSKFVHIGTTKEYINFFCCDSIFQSEMGLEKDVFNLWIDNEKRSNENGSGDIESEASEPKKLRLSDTLLGCVMHSILPHDSYISSTAVLEYCSFNIPVTVGQSCILSNCAFDSKVKIEFIDHCLFVGNEILMLYIPNDIFIHTVPIIKDGVTRYVTVFFDVNDNLKKEAPQRDMMLLPFLGKLVEDYAMHLNIPVSAIKPNADDTSTKINLWFANLFPVTFSMSESLVLTLSCINAVKNKNSNEVSLASHRLVSMATILKEKDLTAMLDYRTELYKCITEG